MKNYNGIHNSACSINEHFPTTKTPITHSSTQSKPYIRPEEGFSAKDVKVGYTKALSYIDKLKAEQDNLKNTLKMTLAETQPINSGYFSPSKGLSSPSIANMVSWRDQNTNKLLESLQLENAELKEQLDCAILRIDKLQKEKQILEGQAYNVESRNRYNLDHINETKSLKQTVHSLEVKLKEVEEENLKLLKDKEREKSRSKYFQEPSQNLLKYINYITKLVSSMPHSNSIRNYFEERFPRNVDICEQLISGQFEPVLLSAFKYITDLLVNLSPGSQGRESLQSPKQNANNYGHFGHQNDSRKASAPFQREFSDESFSHRQPSQEDREYSPDNRYENSPIATSSLRIHKVPNDQSSPHRKKGSQGFEQFKSAFQKIAHEESFSCHQSPQSQKQITKQYSSLAEANNSSHDSHGAYMEKERRRITKDNTPTNEAYQFPTSIDDMNTHSSYYKQKGNENRIRRGEESPERHMSIQGRPRDEEDDYEEEEEPRDLRVKKVTKSSKVTDDRRGSRRDVNDRSNRQITGESPSRKGKIVNQYGFDGMNREGKKSNYSSYMSRENIGLNQSEAQIKPINRRATQDKIGYQSKISSQRAYLDSRSKSIPIFDDYDDLQQKTSEVSMAAVERHPGMKKEKTPKKERQRFFEERGPQQEQDDYGYTNGELDRNRQELSRLSRKVSSLLVNGNLDKSNLSKDYSTFRVSFMRTESKIRNSPSPNDNLPSILDVPKKKRILQLKNKFDLITGKEKLGVAPHTTKAQGEKSNIQSSIFESSIKTDQEKKAGSRIKDSQKSILTNKTSMESVLVENASKVETNH